MNRTLVIIVAIVGLLGLGGIGWLWYQRNVATPEAPAATPPAVVIEPTAKGPPPIQYPVPAPPADEATPPPQVLDESDDAFKRELGDLFGAQPIDAYLVPKQIVRQIVVTIDSLTDKPVALRLRPLRAVEGNLLVQGEARSATLDAANAKRYEPLVAALQAADAQRISAVYFRYYPLFQKAYDELGKPGYFNDRLVAVIDHLLAAPEPQGPLALVRPKVYWQYADPELEQLSSGQKALIRIGADNAAAVKAKLAELREVLVTRAQEATTVPAD
jgi:hypothetical protein